MFQGYACILTAAMLWGTSVVVAKHMLSGGHADPLFLSQARSTLAWLLIGTSLLIFRPRLLKVRKEDLWRFLALGVIGISGANFLLYFAVEGMESAVADLIQFLAPAMVVIWMWWRRHEPLDMLKGVALVLSLIGCALALGAFGKSWHAPPLRAGSALLSAVSYAFLLIWGKDLSRRYPTATYLHYGLMGAALFWSCITPPWVFIARFQNWTQVAQLTGFAIMSVAAPYTFFFLGLRRLPASRAGIASTFEPVFITLAAWAFLDEHLKVVQVIGILLVLMAIVVLELCPAGQRAQTR